MDREHSTTFIDHLAQVPDPRCPRGRRFEWRILLAIITAGLASGHKSPGAIADWMKEHAEELLDQLKPAKGRLPSLTTLWRALHKVQRENVEQQVAVHNQALDREDAPATQVEAANGELLQGQSLDGKELRGARAHGAASFLVSLARHGSGYVLAQVGVPSKGHELRGARQLLAGQDLTGTVTSMDARLTQRWLARLIRAQGGHYLMVVKCNQEELYRHIELLFQQPPVPALPGEWLCYRYSEKGHGRLETRTLECSTALQGYLDWPGAAQVMRRTCRRVNLRTGEVEQETTYGISSLDRTLAGPKQLEQFWRGHWTIENREHYVRDDTMGEDRGQVHAGNAPQVLAALRNGLITLLHHRGWSNVAEALRHYGAFPQRALRLIGWSTQ
jgi:predicted transposase YbfD/YdcC